MSDVFREVDDEVRREKASEFWKRYGKIVVGVALVIVIGVGGLRLWDYWQDRQAANLGDRFAAAIALAEEGDTEGAELAFAAISDESLGGYPLLARLAAAAEQARGGDVDGAITAYRSVAADADGPLADLARLRAAYLMVGRSDSDAIMNTLASAVGEDSPFYLSAQEVLGLEAWSREALDVAETHFLAILAAANPPTGLRSRAEIMLDLIAGSGGTAPTVEPLPAPTVTAPALTAPILETPVLTAPTPIAPDADPLPETEPAPLEAIPSEAAPGAPANDDALIGDETDR